MRAVVLALTLALVARQSHCAPKFKTDSTYVYKYEAWLSSGLPEENLAQSGIRISSKVLISAETEQNHLLKLVDTQIFEINGVWSENGSIPAQKLTSAVAKHLVHPIRFQYKNGGIAGILAPPSVPTLLMNIHRGVLNLLVTTIKQKHSYELQEKGAQGECKTMYVHSEEDRNGHTSVIKIRDLSDCKDSVIKNMGLAYTDRYPYCQQDEKSLRGTTTFNYILKNRIDHVQILNVTVKELVHFSPFGPVNGDIEMDTWQKLSFVEIQKTPIVPSRETYVSRGSLKHEFESKLSRMPLQLIKTKNLRDQIVKILDHLVKLNSDWVSEDAPEHFFRMIQLLRSAKADDLDFFWNQISLARRPWILDFLAAVGTPDALRLIKDKFLEGKVEIGEMAQAMVTSVHMVTATTETFDIFKELVNNTKVKESRVLYPIIMLGYGTMIAKHCSDQARCAPDHIKFMHDLLSRATSPPSGAEIDIEEIILILKAIGNGGHFLSLKPITKILPISHNLAAQALPLRVQVEALMALRNIAKKEPEEVQDRVYQIYTDKDLDVELRMLACIVLLESNPKANKVTALVNFLKTEENLQLASFTYSHMKALCWNTFGIRPSVAAACSLARKTLGKKLDRPSLRFSRVFKMDVYNETSRLGASATAFYINDAASAIPKSAMAKSSVYFMGAAAEIAQVGIRTDGLQELLLKNPTLLDNSDRLTKMKTAIKALFQRKSQRNADPLVSVYHNVMGQEIGYANIDQSTFDKVFELRNVTNWRENILSLLSGISWSSSKSLLLSEVRRIMPTAAGLPLELSLFTAAVAAAKATVKAKVTPELQEKFTISELLERDVQLDVVVRPSIALRSIASMGINTEMLQSAIMSRLKFKAVAPTNISAELNIKDGKFKVQALPVTLPERVTEVQFDTVVVNRNIDNLAAERVTPLIPEQVQNPVPIDSTTSQMENSGSLSTEVHFYNKAEPLVRPKEAQVEMEYTYKTLGLTGKVVMTTQNAAFIRDTSLYAVAGKHSVVVTITPVPGEVYEKLEVEVLVSSCPAMNLMKLCDPSQEEILESKPVLMKLRQLLAPPANSTSSSSRSSQSSLSSSSSKSSSSSRSSSSSSSSKRSSSSSGGSSSSSSGSSSSGGSSKLRSKSSRSSSSSSASNLASLFSGSSSASHQSAHVAERIAAIPRFTKYNKKQANSEEAMDPSSSWSSGGSSQARFIDSPKTSSIEVTARAVRGGTADGYQLVVNMDKANKKVQLTLADLAPKKFAICVDGVIENNHRASVRIRTRTERKRYRADLTAEAGLVRQSPAARLRMTWDRIPAPLKRAWKRAMKNIPTSILPSFEMLKNRYNESRASITVISHNEKAVDIVLKTPMCTVIMLVVPVPVTLPIKEMTDLIPFDDVVDKIHFVVAKATAAECSYAKDRLTTFNMMSYQPHMPQSCYQILAQDCTDELKFIVLWKRDKFNQNYINVKIADIDIDLYHDSISPGVRVNGKEMSLPYQHLSAKVLIRPSRDGVSIYAPAFGLHEVYYDKNTWKVKVVDWMKGQTCGICGMADGETKQEFRTPSGFVSENPVTSAHSWILPADSCKGTSECRIKLESIELEKQAVIYGQESRCFSVQPVLRCLPGCFPVKTAPITVDFHCVAAESNLNKSEVLRGIHEKSIDLKESAEAHLACSCTPQCV